MKKSTFFVFVSILCCYASWADSAESGAASSAPEKSVSTDSDEYLQIAMLLEDKRVLNKADGQKVMDLSMNLTATERFNLYSQYRQEGNWGWLNYPFGIGSLVMGDYGTTGVQMSAEFAGYLLFGIGFASGYTHSGNQNVAAVMTAGGAVTMLGGLLYGMIRPWFFASEQNQILKKSLRLTE